MWRGWGYALAYQKTRETSRPGTTGRGDNACTPSPCPTSLGESHDYCKTAKHRGVPDAYLAISGSLRDSVSSSDSTVLAKLPVITVVDGAPGTARRKRANWHAIAATAIIAAMPAINPYGCAAGS